MSRCSQNSFLKLSDFHCGELSEDTARVNWDSSRGSDTHHFLGTQSERVPFKCWGSVAKTKLETYLSLVEATEGLQKIAKVRPHTIKILEKSDKNQ